MLARKLQLLEHGISTSTAKKEPMKLFAGLRKIRALEARHLPFVRSVIEYDIVIEIGYHEERGSPLTLKKLLTMGVCSRTTIRRKLRSLIHEGIISRTKLATDGRASSLGITHFTKQRLTKYRSAMFAIVAPPLE